MSEGIEGRPVDRLVERLRLIAAWHTPGGPTPSEPMPERHTTILQAADEIERAARAEEWIRAQAAKCPHGRLSGNTYSTGFDNGYALAMKQAARAFDAAPNAPDNAARSARVDPVVGRQRTEGEA